MRILTVSASPYLLTRLGRINSDILCSFKEAGHQVSSAVWHLDTTWFMPQEGTEQFVFEKDSGVVCSIFPFTNGNDQTSIQLYEIMKKVQPDIVISIGDYTEVACVAPVKSLYPQLFKWIAILSLSSGPINERDREVFDNIDKAIALSSFAHKEISEIIGEDCELLPYGPDPDVFYPLETHNRTHAGLKVLNCGKNSQSANLGCFINAIATTKREDITATLHTNIYDIGDYDIHLLLDRLDCSERITLPQRYVGLNDGLSDEEMNKMYNSHDVIADVSVRASTGITLLEAMATGCIPICSKADVLADIISRLSHVGLWNLDSQEELLVPCVEFIGAKEETYQIASSEGLKRILLNLCEMKQLEPNVFEALRHECIEVAAEFKKECFLRKMKKITKEVSDSLSKVTVEHLG